MEVGSWEQCHHTKDEEHYLTMGCMIVNIDVNITESRIIQETNLWLFVCDGVSRLC